MELLPQLLLQIIIACVVAYFAKAFLRWRKLPKGPWGLPFIGYSWFIPFQFEDHIRGLFAKYGKLFTVNIYGTDVVMISDVELVKKCLLKDVFNHRPKKWAFTLMEEPNLISWNGEEWKEQRKFALRMFKQIGMGKDVVEKAIHDEIDYLLKKIEEGQEKNPEKGADIEKLIGSSASNVIGLMITGDRFDFDHPVRMIVDKVFLLRDNPAPQANLGILNYLTWFVRFMVMVIPSGILKEQMQNFEYVLKYLTERMEYFKKNFNPETDEPVNFMQAYQSEMRHVSPDKKYFDDFHLYSNASAFFQAGNATTKDFIGWCVQSLIVYPDVQEKMRLEIDNQIGFDRNISMKDKPNLPYCEAFFSEVERTSSAVPLSIIHEVAADAELGPYLLPKGTHLMVNTWAIHSDPEYFPEPEKFKPERFLSDDGKKFIKNDNLIGFGTGKRSCPGEPLAKTEVFLYITTFVHKYILCPIEGAEVNLDAKIDFLSRVPKHEIRCLFKPRK